MSTLTNAVFTNLGNDEAVIVQDFSNTTIFRNNGKSLVKTRLTSDSHGMTLSKPEVVGAPEVDPEAVWFTVTDLAKKVEDQRLYHRISWAAAMDDIVAMESRDANRYDDDDDLAAEIRMESLSN